MKYGSDFDEYFFPYWFFIIIILFFLQININPPLFQGNPAHPNWKVRWAKMETPLKWMLSSRMMVAPQLDIIWSNIKL